MSNNICIPANYFFILIIVFILFNYMYYYSFSFQLNKMKIENNLKNNDTIQVTQNEDNNTFIKNNKAILPLQQLIENSNKSILNYSIVDKSEIIVNPFLNPIDQQKIIVGANPSNPIYRKVLENRDRTIISDPIIAPERRVDVVQYPMTIQNTINIPTRGYPDNYQMMGIVSRESDEKILQLFGRATFPGSNQYEYYVTTSEFGFQNKIPIQSRGNKEIVDGDTIHIPEFKKEKGEFRIKLYNYNTPRYNPYII